MKKIFITLFIIAIGTAVYIWRDAIFSGGGINMSGATYDAVSEISRYQYSQTFGDASYGFSFKYPEDFTVTPVSGENEQTILVQNLAKKIGVQVIITPFPVGDVDLAKEILADVVPDMKITDAKQIAVSGGKNKSLSFTSDNDAFGGKSREIWFVEQGNLYQLSTYAETGDFLNGLFGTWTFI